MTCKCNAAKCTCAPCTHGVCPNCGYCPCCGRSNTPKPITYPWPIYPGIYPIQPYSPPWSTITINNDVTLTHSLNTTQINFSAMISS